jgi:hypothetical protein
MPAQKPGARIDISRPKDPDHEIRVADSLLVMVDLSKMPKTNDREAKLGGNESSRGGTILAVGQSKRVIHDGYVNSKKGENTDQQFEPDNWPWMRYLIGGSLDRLHSLRMIVDQTNRHDGAGAPGPFDEVQSTRSTMFIDQAEKQNQGAAHDFFWVQLYPKATASRRLRYNEAGIHRRLDEDDQGIQISGQQEEAQLMLNVSAQAGHVTDGAAFSHFGQILTHPDPNAPNRAFGPNSKGKLLTELALRTDAWFHAHFFSSGPIAFDPRNFDDHICRKSEGLPPRQVPQIEDVPEPANKPRDRCVPIVGFMYPSAKLNFLRPASKRDDEMQDNPLEDNPDPGKLDPIRNWRPVVFWNPNETSIENPPCPPSIPTDEEPEIPEIPTEDPVQEAIDKFGELSREAIAKRTQMENAAAAAAQARSDAATARAADPNGANPATKAAADAANAATIKAADAANDYKAAQEAANDAQIDASRKQQEAMGITNLIFQSYIETPQPRGPFGAPPDGSAGLEVSIQAIRAASCISLDYFNSVFLRRHATGLFGTSDDAVQFDYPDERIAAGELACPLPGVAKEAIAEGALVAQGPTGIVNALGDVGTTETNLKQIIGTSRFDVAVGDIVDADVLTGKFPLLNLVAGLTLTIGDTIYLSSTEKGKGTNVAPNATEGKNSVVGPLVDASTYRNTGKANVRYSPSEETITPPTPPIVPGGTFLFTNDDSDLADAGFLASKKMLTVLGSSGELEATIITATAQNVIEFYTEPGVPGFLDWLPQGDATWSATIEVLEISQLGTLTFLGFTVKRVDSAGVVVPLGQTLFLGTGLPADITRGIFTGTGTATQGPGFGSMNPAARAATDRLRFQVVLSHDNTPAIDTTIKFRVGFGVGKLVTTI